MFREEPPPLLDSFLQNSCESVSLSWNCLWYFFPKGIECLLFHSSVLRWHRASVWFLEWEPQSLSCCQWSCSAAVLGKCSCVLLNRVRPWHSWNKGSSEVSTKRFSQNCDSDALVSQWTEGLVFTGDLFVSGEASSSLLTIQGVWKQYWTHYTLLPPLPCLPKAF